MLKPCVPPDMMGIESMDQSHYLRNCVPIPPPTQQQTTDNMLGSMLG